jgi:NACalpha-BTF3-like transcription factor
MAQQSAPAPDEASNTQQAAQNQTGGQRHAMNPDKQAKHLAKKLGLNQDQVAQIKPILTERQSEMQNLRADTTLTPQDRHAKAQSIQQDSQSKIEAVLNDTQKQQFEQMLAARRAHHNQKQPS